MQGIMTRDIGLDNFKFILIAVVVIGHSIEPILARFEWLKVIYTFIYLFHMPMFAYASGVVSTKVLDNRAISSIVQKLIIPYISLEIIYSVFDFYLFSRGTLNISPLVPYWILWYLFSLVLWRLLLPFFNQFKFPVVLALIAGLACGINTLDYNLSFSRTFVFLPFFLIGHYHHSTIVKILDNYKFRTHVGAAFISCLFVALWFISEIVNINFGWLYGSRSYSSLNTSWELGVLYRSSMYALAFILGLVILALTPRVSNAFTRYGKDSLYIYVLHGFVMKGLIALGFYNFINADYKAVIFIFSSLILLPILSSEIAIWFGKQLTNPLRISPKKAR